MLTVASACEEDEVIPKVPESTCATGQREVVFVLDGSSPLIQCAVFDTLRAVEPGCTLVVYTIVDGNPSDTFFRYEGLAGDTGAPCGGKYFFAVAKHEQGHYFFDGLTRRRFDAGTGPFASGSFEVLDDQTTLIDAGTFDFFEDTQTSGAGSDRPPAEVQ